MNRKLIYTAVFSALLMVAGCGGSESDSTNDTTGQISEKRNLTYITDEDGNYYLDFSEMKSSAKAIIQTSGKFYTYDDDRKEGTYGDQEGLKTYYNEKNIIKFEYLENDVVKADIFDRKNGFIKRIFTVIRNGELYAQETTDVDVVNIDESKPLTLYSGVSDDINKIIDTVAPLPTTASSTLSKGINFSFFPTAHAIEYGVSDRSNRNNFFSSAVGAIFITFAAEQLIGGAAASVFIAAPVLLPIAIGVFGSIILYENSSKFREFLEDPFDNVKKGSINLLNNLVNVLIPNANASEEEVEYWSKLLEDERKKCLASGMKLINGICKKEEEPQCLAEEILVEGICKKKEPVCLVDEILVDGVCKKKEPTCLVDEILVDGVCKKKEPICAQDEVLENGKCIKKPIETSSFTKIGPTGQKLLDNATQWNCVLDKETGLLWERKSTNYHAFNYIYYRYSWFEDSTGFDYPIYQTPNTSSCVNTLPKCNTKAYIQTMNEEKWCGYDNWRLPTKDELVIIGKKEKLFNLFNNETKPLWTSTTNIDREAWVVSFNYGTLYSSEKYSEHPVILVRNSN